MLSIFDSHLHLWFGDFNDDLDNVITRSRAAGVGGMLTLGIDWQSSLKSIKLAERYPHIWAAVGLHPNEPPERDDDIEKIRKIIGHPKVIAIGEIGLDYYRDHTPKDIQITRFREQIEMAVEGNLPASIHLRGECFDDAKTIIEDYPTLRAVLHSFSGNMDFLQWALERGFYIGFTGVVSFKNFKEHYIIKALPLKHLLVETDAPFLAPIPYRGKRNEPAYITHTLKAIAMIKNISTTEIIKATTTNAAHLFNIEAPRDRKIHHKKSSLSQVFLTDQHRLQRIALSLPDSNLAVEIGAGSGNLTVHLTKRYPKIIAIEPDYQLIDILAKRCPKAIVVPRDVMKIDMSAIARWAKKSLLLYGNLPYHITSPILFHILMHRDAIAQAALVVQREFARRLTALVGEQNYGIPTVLAGNYYKISSEMEIPRSVFSPEPDVDSTLIVMRRRKYPIQKPINEGIFEDVVRLAFAARRKQLKNTPLFQKYPVIAPPSSLAQLRAGEITIKQFVELANEIARRQK